MNGVYVVPAALQVNSAEHVVEHLGVVLLLELPKDLCGAVELAPALLEAGVLEVDVRLVIVHAAQLVGRRLAEMAVAERLERPVGDEGAEQPDVGDEGAQVGLLGDVAAAGADVGDGAADADVALKARREIERPS